MLTTWPVIGTPITPPVVVTRSRDGGRNAGDYRLRVFDPQTTDVHWHMHHDGAANFREGRLEVAVALGTDPSVAYAATAPLPTGVDEFAFAGFYAASRWSWRRARQWRWSCLTRRSSWRTTWSVTRSATRVRAVITPATIR